MGGNSRRMAWHSAAASAQNETTSKRLRSRAKRFGCNPQCRPVASWYGRNSPAYRLLGYNALAPEAETRTRTGALEPVLQPGTSVAAILLLVALVAFHLRPR